MFLHIFLPKVPNRCNSTNSAPVKKKLELREHLKGCFKNFRFFVELFHDGVSGAVPNRTLLGMKSPKLNIPNLQCNIGN